MAATLYHEGRFPPLQISWERLIPLVGPANAAIARYEGLLHGIPNAQVLLSPLASQEAVLSSRIEGTQATLGEVLEFEATQESSSPEKRHDIQEVLNYRHALRHAVDAMKTLPLSQRVIRDAHRVLMQGVRGENKSPGEYRRTANWIGPPGCSANEARFVPPGADRLLDLVSAWEQYLHAEAPDRLVQLAILHAEFEAIHPFLDGNGRLGRLLVPLFLVHKRLLNSPEFFISAYLEARRDEYYDRLLAVSRDDDWTGWCVFFLQALTAQARDNQSKAEAIIDLYNAKKEWITEAVRSRHAIRALDWFFSRPIFKSSDFQASSRIPSRTAIRILGVARRAGMLRTLRLGRGRQPTVLVFPALLNISEGHEVF